MFDTVNWVGVVIASIVAFGFNALWFGPLFGKRWAAARGLTDAAAAGTPLPPILIANFVMQVLSSAALAALVLAARTSIISALFVAFLVWVASGLTVTLNELLFARRPATAFFIDSIGHLLTLLIVALIVSVGAGRP